MMLGIVLGIAGVLVLLPFAMLSIAFAFSDKSVCEFCPTTPPVNHPPRSSRSVLGHVSP